MAPAVELTHLNYAYGPVTVINDLSFSVAQGRLTIIIGPNGSGKTTLLKLMAGLAPAARGAVTLLGRDITAYPRRELARTLAIVPQLVSEDFPFSVKDVVLMGRAPHTGILGIEGGADTDIAREAMAAAGVAQLADRRIGELSGGERQRVFIARALCQQPKILLLDEPTAALDLAHQVRIMDIMAELAETNGLTVVMVSHDINLAAMYADEMVLLSRGKVMAAGDPETVLKKDILQETYSCRIHIDRHPLTATPRISPVPGKRLPWRE
ncbi:MAG: heme ABC transporter ATP-binding protein [Pseudomonadota bacterium]